MRRIGTIAAGAALLLLIKVYVVPYLNASPGAKDETYQMVQAAKHENMFGNVEKAFALYTKAALAGNESAMWAVASMYERGRGTAPSVKESLRWYLRISKRYYINPDVAKKLRDYEMAGIKLDTLIDQPDSLLRNVPTGF